MHGMHHSSDASYIGYLLHCMYHTSEVYASYKSCIVCIIASSIICILHQMHFSLNASCIVCIMYRMHHASYASCIECILHKMHHASSYTLCKHCICIILICTQTSIEIYHLVLCCFLLLRSACEKSFPPKSYITVM